jgi:hypothetical protein
MSVAAEPAEQADALVLFGAAGDFAPSGEPLPIA